MKEKVGLCLESRQAAGKSRKDKRDESDQTTYPRAKCVLSLDFELSLYR